MKKVLITYGDQNYRDSLLRIKKEASEIGIFDNIWLYDEEKLPATFKDYTTKFKRGGGYWLWKPWIIDNALSRLDEGDIVVYVDAGCTLFSHSDWDVYFSLLKEKDAVFFLAAGKSKKWCKKDVFNYFNPKNNIWKFANQIQATAMLIKKSDNNSIISCWKDLAENHPELFTDVPKELEYKEDSSFKEHRHDQSVLTGCVCFSQPFNKYCILPEKMEKKARNGQAILASRISTTGTRGTSTSSRPPSRFVTYLNRILTDPFRIFMTRLYFRLSRLKF